MRLRFPIALALLLAAALPAACTTTGPIVPYPDVVHVPNPLRLPEGPAREDLLERYSASPNRNPDGLGVLGTIWLNSRMTLVTWPQAQAREARNRIAYARTPAEQQRVLTQAHALYAEHWVFEGVLLGDVDSAVSVDFYQPDGIYIVDDRGRKFLPVAARDADPLTRAQVHSRYGDAHYAYPRLIFPEAAITPRTRAISLYFAALNKRLRFTWAFDPDAPLPDGGSLLDSGRETNRLFPAQ
ncbi:MAG TPA: hypothetical protein VKB51_15895 [bacterium]|nr:hypothetical protein [bacterium]